MPQQNDLKKAVSILLLIGLLVYTGGSFVAFKFMQFQKKQEVKAFIKENPKSSLAEKLSFCVKDLNNNSNFEWEEEGKEFKLYDEMYDVINSVTIKDTVHFLAIKDKGESLLIEHFQTLMKHQTNKSSNSTSLLKLLTSVFVITNNELVFFSHQSFLVHFSSYFFVPASITKGVTIPPPQV